MLVHWIWLAHRPKVSDKMKMELLRVFGSAEEIYTAEPEAFDDIQAALGEKGIETVSAEVTMVPDNTVKVEGDAAVKMQKMLDALDENDDVQEVYGNYEMDEE